MEELGTIQLEKRKIISAKGENSLSQLQLEDHTLFPLDGLFVALGTADSTDIARKLGLFMEDNHILIEADTSTPLPASLQPETVPEACCKLQKLCTKVHLQEHVLLII